MEQRKHATASGFEIDCGVAGAQLHVLHIKKDEHKRAENYNQQREADRWAKRQKDCAMGAGDANTTAGGGMMAAMKAARRAKTLGYATTVPESMKRVIQREEGVAHPSE